MTRLPSDLIEALREGRLIPFVGSGVSRCLGLPSWNELIDHLGAELQYDSDVFRSLDSGNLALAEYYKLERGGIGALRSWMDRTWDVPDSEIRASKVHAAICALNCPLIYTTNFDRLLERAHELRGRNVHKVVTTRDLVRLPRDSTVIVKFHGDLTDDGSLVLTETDYFRRLDFNSALDVRLQSDALGKSILFLGYSLADINMRLLLYRLLLKWRTADELAYQPKSYILMTHPDVVQERILATWGVQAIVSEGNDATIGLERFLELLAREAFPERAAQ